MRTYVYVDGFNLYYGALRGTPYKWLNLPTLCTLLLPGYQVEKMKYFTAHIQARPDDPDQPTRQQVYLRALSTLPNLEIILGHFLPNASPCGLSSPQRWALPLYGSSRPKRKAQWMKKRVYFSYPPREPDGSEHNHLGHAALRA